MVEVGGWGWDRVSSGVRVGVEQPVLGQIGVEEGDKGVLGLKDRGEVLVVDLFDVVAVVDARGALGQIKPEVGVVFAEDVEPIGYNVGESSLQGAFGVDVGR